MWRSSHPAGVIDSGESGIGPGKFDNNFSFFSIFDLKFQDSNCSSGDSKYGCLNCRWTPKSLICFKKCVKPWDWVSSFSFLPLESIGHTKKPASGTGCLVCVMFWIAIVLTTATEVGEQDAEQTWREPRKSTSQTRCFQGEARIICWKVLQLLSKKVQLIK